MTTSSEQGKQDKPKPKQDATVRVDHQDIGFGQGDGNHQRAGNGQPVMTTAQGFPRVLTIKIRLMAASRGRSCSKTS